MKTNKFHTYMRETSPRSNVFEFYYTIDSNKKFETWRVDPTKIQISGSGGNYTAVIVGPDPSQDDGIFITAIENSSLPNTVIPHKGKITITGRTAANIRISLDISDGSGGNGTTTHYGDADQ